MTLAALAPNSRVSRVSAARLLRSDTQQRRTVRAWPPNESLSRDVSSEPWYWGLGSFLRGSPRAATIVRRERSPWFRTCSEEEDEEARSTKRTVDSVILVSQAMGSMIRRLTCRLKI